MAFSQQHVFIGRRQGSHECIQCTNIQNNVKRLGHTLLTVRVKDMYPIAEAPVGHNILSRRAAYVQLNAQLAPVIIVLTSVYSQKDILWEKYDFG